METTGTCTEAGCDAEAESRCDGPTGVGCEQLFCDDHLYYAGDDGELCNDDYNRIEVRA